MNNAATKTILITGCTNGIGLEASKILYQLGHNIILVGRTLEKAKTAKNTIEHLSSSKDSTSAKLIPLECDFSSFDSINNFATNFQNVFENKIDVVCLNAGMCATRNTPPSYTKDNDIELTLMTNHFGPFLFLKHILPFINTSSGRVIFTGSGVHKSEKKPVLFNHFKGIQLNDDNQFQKITMINGTQYDHYQSYALSKLCNVTTSLALQKRLEKSQQYNQITSNCFCPNLITSTGLFRSQGPISQTIFGFFANTIFGFGDTLDWGAGALAFMAVDERVKGGGNYWKGPTGISRKGGKYGVDFIPVDVSQEASNVQNQDKLWDLSAQVVGIEQDFF